MQFKIALYLMYPSMFAQACLWSAYLFIYVFIYLRNMNRISDRFGSVAYSRASISFCDYWGEPNNHKIDTEIHLYNTTLFHSVLEYIFTF